MGHPILLESAPQGRRRLQSFFPKSGAWYRPRICSTASPCSQKYLLRPSQKDFPEIVKKTNFRKYFTNIFQKKHCFSKKSQNLKISRFSKIIFPNQKLSKKFENLGIFKFGKTKYSGKKSFWFSTKYFFAHVEKCQNPLLIPYRIKISVLRPKLI